MVQKPHLLLVWLLLTIISAKTSAQGADVVLLLNDGRQIAGELLTVRDSSLVISVGDKVHAHEVADFTKDAVVVRTEEILQVIIKGKSNILKGMGQGILIGGGIGALVGFASGDDPPGWFSLTAGQKALALGVVLGGSGLVIGTIAGIASSTSDRSFEPLGGYGFSFLKPAARYPQGWPQLPENIHD